MSQCPLLAGRLLPGVVVPAGGFISIPHGLGRAPLGWFLVSPKSAALVWEDVEYAGQDRARVLRLQATVASTAPIWVF